MLEAYKKQLVLCPDCGCWVNLRRHTREQCQRIRLICELRPTMTLAEIAAKLGVTKERVRQILLKRFPPN